MQYRKFGKLDWKPSALGFGAMRLPTIDNDTARINEPEAIRMIRHAIDHGLNYVDTAYPYHQGQSEVLVGKALQDGYREQVKLATKMPTWLTKTAEDFDRYLDEQLARLQTGHIDFYLLHGLNADRWSQLQALNVTGWAEKQMAAGRIHHLCFSFHDTFEAYKTIVDAYDNWTMSQLYYNYLSEDHQAGTRGLEYGASKGLAIVIMGPISGGLLSQNPPAPVQTLWNSAAHKRSAAEWALQWVWNHPEVSVVLSGMSTMEQVEENLASADRSGAGSLSAEEVELVARARDTYMSLRPIGCTDCKYCQPCPNDVAIPQIFSLYNMAFMHNAADQARRGYGHVINEKHHAEQCLECGECESQCPQNLAIIDWLPKVHAFLTAN